MLLSHKVECVTIFFKMYQILWIKKHINWTIQPPLTPQTAKSHGLSQPPFESWKGQRATLSKLRGKQILCKPWWVQRITFNPPTKILKQPLHILLLTNQNHLQAQKKHQFQFPNTTIRFCNFPSLSYSSSWVHPFQRLLHKTITKK